MYLYPHVRRLLIWPDNWWYPAGQFMYSALIPNHVNRVISNEPRSSSIMSSRGQGCFITGLLSAEKEECWSVVKILSHKTFSVFKTAKYGLSLGRWCSLQLEAQQQTEYWTKSVSKCTWYRLVVMLSLICPHTEQLVMGRDLDFDPGTQTSSPMSWFFGSWNTRWGYTQSYTHPPCGRFHPPPPPSFGGAGETIWCCSSSNHKVIWDTVWMDSLKSFFVLF